MSEPLSENWRMDVAESLPCWVDADGRICDLVPCEHCREGCDRCDTAVDGTPPGWVPVPRTEGHSDE